MSVSRGRCKERESKIRFMVPHSSNKSTPETKLWPVPVSAFCSAPIQNHGLRFNSLILALGRQSEIIKYCHNQTPSIRVGGRRGGEEREKRKIFKALIRGRGKNSTDGKQSSSQKKRNIWVN